MRQKICSTHQQARSQRGPAVHHTRHVDTNLWGILQMANGCLHAYGPHFALVFKGDADQYLWICIALKISLSLPQKRVGCAVSN